MSIKLSAFPGASLVALAAFAAPASAQVFNGMTGAAPTSTTTAGTSTTSTTGDSTVAPFQNTTTTVLNQSVNSVTAPTTTGVTTTVDGVVYTGTKTVSGTGSQGQTVTGVRVDTFTPGNPPVLANSVLTPGTPVNVGAATVTAVSASGTVGNVSAYGSTLSTSGPVTNGSVVATENSTTISSSGVVFAQRVGTATYAPSTGLVTVALPTAATSSTSIGLSGIATTGTVSAGSFVAAPPAGGVALNAGGGRITNVANGIAATDAVNLGQFNAFTTATNASIAAFGSTLNNGLANNRLSADAGTAVAVAMSGGFFLPNKKFNITANIGHYRDQTAISGQIGALVTENVALNAGVATSIGGFGSGTAVRGGVTFGF